MIYVHMKKLLPPVMAALLLASCGNNTLGASEGAVSQEVTVTLGTSDTVQTSETTTVTEEVTEQTTTMPQLEFEDTPQNAYTRLTMSFQSTGKTVYPDDYGGVYSYGKNLFVAITEKEPSEYYTSLLSEYTCVRYQTVAHSMNELTAIGEKAKEVLDPDFGVKEVFIDVPNNRAAVSITNGDPRSAQDYIKTLEDVGFTLNEVEISMADTEE